MELVYLWVEGYKNIKNQGFNFSSKFNCKYDYKNNELTINKNDDYIENFFGKNINITAIVGKNGSGKSNILEAFIYLYLGNLYNEQDKVIFSIYFHNGKYYLSHNCDKLWKINSNTIPLENEKTFLMYYNYSLDAIVFEYDKIDKEIIDNSNFHRIRKDNHNSLIMQPEKSQICINNKYINEQSMKYILKFLILDDIRFSNIKEFFIPNNFKLSFEYKTIQLDEDIFDNKAQKVIKDRINIFYRPDGFVNEFNRDELMELNILYIITQTLKKLREAKDDFNIELKEDFEKKFLHKDEYIIHNIYTNNINTLIDYIKDN
jgi:hypothetical protein